MSSPRGVKALVSRWMMPPTGPRRHGAVVLVAAVTLAGVVALWVVGRVGAAAYLRLGVEDPGALVRLATAAARVVVDVSASLAVGALAFAVVLTAPCGADGLVSVEGYRAVRAAARWAVLWCAAAAAMVSLSAASDAGLGLGVLASPARWWGLVDAQEEPRTWLAASVLAALVVVAARTVLTWRGAGAVLLVALLGLLPPLAAGHSSSDTNHDVATEAIAVHVPFAAVWLGVLARVLLRAPGLGPARSAILDRYARLASVCWVVVAGSGLVDAAVLVPDRAGLAGSGYGRLLLAKTAVVVVVGAVVVLGRRAVPRRVELWPWRLAVELLGLGAALGASSASAQLFPPAFALPVTIPQTLLGYSLPGRPGLAVLVLAWRPEVWAGGLAVAMVVLYLRGVRRLAGAGRRWPRSCTLSWLLGCGVLLVATCSGIGRYEPAMFSIHILSHLLGGVVAPGLLVQGAPLSLALASSPAEGGTVPGGVEWVGALLSARPVRLLTHPLVALGLFAAAPFAVYFTPLFDAVARFHWAHLMLAVLFLIVGYLFAWPTIGVDAVPQPVPNLVRLVMLLVAGPVNAVFAALVVTTQRVLGNGPAGYTMYRSLQLPWVVDLRADQRLGGTLALVLGEAALLAAVVVLLVRWRRLDDDASAGGIGRAHEALAQARR